MTKQSARKVEGFHFTVEVIGNSPSTYCAKYTGCEGIARVEIEGGLPGTPEEWVIYSQTLEPLFEPHSGAVSSASDDILRKISDSLSFLGNVLT